MPKLQLPDFATEAGAVAHLLLAESLTPHYLDYGDGKDVFRAMELMREVLDNRLAAAQSSDALRRYVACCTSANDLRDIVHADRCAGSTKAQFDGFDGARSTPHESKLKTIHQLLLQANDGTNSFHEKSRAHIEKAIEVASRPTNITTITDSSWLYWRTVGQGSPSPHTKQPLVLAGQAFFSLSDNFLKNPENPGKP